MLYCYTIIRRQYLHNVSDNIYHKVIKCIMFTHSYTREESFMKNVIHAAKIAGNELHIMRYQIGKIIWTIISSILFIPAFIMGALNKLKFIITAVISYLFYSYTIWEQSDFNHLCKTFKYLFVDSFKFSDIGLIIALTAVLSLAIYAVHKAVWAIHAVVCGNVCDSDYNIMLCREEKDKNRIIMKYGSMDNYYSEEIKKFKDNLWYVER